MENVCRTCLRVPDQLLPLHDDLVYKIETISSLKIIQNENYPSNICHECINHVKTFYNFRKVMINSDKEIRERIETLSRMPLKTEIKIEEDPLTINSEPAMATNLAMSMVEETEIINFDKIRESARKKAAQPKIFHCNDCSCTFTSKFKYWNHNKTYHRSGVCNICGAIIRQDNLKRHIKMHSERPVDCKECGRTLKNTESLRAHLLLHKNEVYMCEVCGKKYKVKADYKRHLRSHQDPDFRRVMCTLCGKRVRHLKKHMLSHTGERPFVCSYCEKGFTTGFSLKTHIRQHTNEKPYVCEFCSVGFHQKVSLTTHLKSKHSVTS